LTGFFAAVEFLTRFPVPGTYRLDAATPWFPVVGLLLGGILALLDFALRAADVDLLVVSAVDVAALLLFSGALHADGLMDTCDAVFGHASPERRLEIMRDPRAGTFGVVGLVCVVTLKIAAVHALPLAIRPYLLGLGPCLGRWAIVLAASAFPYGRSDGLGAPLKAAATVPTLLMTSLVPLGACLVLGPVGLLVGALSVIVTLALGRWLVRLLPGLTGDCYGAVCEIVETAVWLSAAPLARALS
jgi:adenosylcobinamide-GDP ribazoletransferase